MAHPVFGRSLAIRGFDATDTPPAALGPIFAPRTPAARRHGDRRTVRRCGLACDGDARQRPHCACSRHSPERLPGLRDSRFLRPGASALRHPAQQPALPQHGTRARSRLEDRISDGYPSPANDFPTQRRAVRDNPQIWASRPCVCAGRTADHARSNASRGWRKASQVANARLVYFRRAHYGPATIVPASINNPDERMPWEPSALRLVWRQG